MEQVKSVFPGNDDVSFRNLTPHKKRELRNRHREKAKKKKKLLGITWSDKQRVSRIREKTKASDISMTIRNKNGTLLGHANKTDNEWPVKLTQWQSRNCVIQGKQYTGRPDKIGEYLLEKNEAQ